jgi:hypothetical protein
MTGRTNLNGEEATMLQPGYECQRPSGRKQSLLFDIRLVNMAKIAILGA